MKNYLGCSCSGIAGSNDPAGYVHHDGKYSTIPSPRCLHKGKGSLPPVAYKKVKGPYPL